VTFTEPVKVPPPGLITGGASGPEELQFTEKLAWLVLLPAAPENARALTTVVCVRWIGCE
jgi:hypothetical protein